MVRIFMTRAKLDTRIAEIESALPNYVTTRQHKARSLLIAELRMLRHERIRRDLRARLSRRVA